MTLRTCLFIIISSIFLLPFSSFGSQTGSITTVRYPIDSSYIYYRELLLLALEKTVDSHGPFELIGVHLDANPKRLRLMVESNHIDNLVFRQSVSMSRLKQLGYTPFPVDRGLVGFRVGFTSHQVADALSNVKTLTELQQFSILQGLGWLDSDILEHNGFEVISASGKTGLYAMVARSRADIFMRGASELKSEWDLQKHIKGLTYDTSVALYYPLPRFFFMNREDQHILDRLLKGLEAAFEDGSFQMLWRSYYSASLDFVDLKNRSIFYLENPFLSDLDKGYERFNYQPELEQ